MASCQEALRVLLGMLAVCSVILVPSLFVRERTVVSAVATWSEFWLVRLAMNLLGYATVAVPIFLMVHYLKRNKYNEIAGNGPFARLLRICAFGNASISCPDPEAALHVEPPPTKAPGLLNPTKGSRGHYLLLCCCFAGLQASFLTWGVLQERIMTRDYETERFHDSQFLVFTNRALAGVVALLGVLSLPQPAHRVPIYQYAYSSLSNILSSWFQYEALKFVSFPTQVLAKASKIIPVMLMGKIVNKRSFLPYEYASAGMISGGVAIFLLSSTEARHPGAVTTMSGVLLLIGYMMFDSFTSNWQDALFKRYHISSLQMMVGANLWSCLLTLTSLLEQGSLASSLAFVGRHPQFATDVLLLSVCSAVGQLFIFFTISQFGAVTFIIIMTMRQGFAILLSCIIYGHPVTSVGLLGIGIVFAAVFLRIFCNTKQRQSAKAAISEPSGKH